MPVWLRGWERRAECAATCHPLLAMWGVSPYQSTFLVPRYMLSTRLARMHCTWRARRAPWVQSTPNHTGDVLEGSANATPPGDARASRLLPRQSLHITETGTGCRDNLFTYYNLEPSLPWKGGWARGPGPACTPISSGADPSPCWAGSWGHSVRPAGVEVEMGEQGRAGGATTGHTEAGAWGQGPGPGISGSTGASQAVACLRDHGLTAGDRHCPRCQLRCQGHGCKGSPSPLGKRPPAGFSGHHAHSVSPAARCPPSP